MLSVHLDDALDSSLDALCAGRGLDKSAFVADVIRRYVERERLRLALQDPAPVSLYNRLEAEDVALAESGLDDYRRGLIEADRR